MAIQFDPLQKTGEAHKAHGHHHNAKQTEKAGEDNIHAQAANKTQKTPNMSEVSAFS